MSGLSPIGSALGSTSSGTSASAFGGPALSASTSGASTAPSTSNLSAVGQSLLTTGQAPNPTPAASTTTTSTSSTSPYQAEYLTLQQQDTAELLYASFLSPADGLANADAVFAQAAQLLGTPGSLASSQSTASSSSNSTSGSTSSGSGSSSTASGSSASSTASDPLSSLPSVASILAASDQEAQQTLNAYSSAPAGSSIIDYQA